jgi:glycosylphosphatidylinositol phospholipase D
LIAFTLGYVSHQIADVTWHSLGVKQGFISAMSNTDFHGSFSQAHDAADTGGDVVNEFELSLKYISDVGDWYIPVDDLYNIYIELYGEVRVNKSDIIECTSIMFLGRLGEQLAICAASKVNFIEKINFWCGTTGGGGGVYS